MNHPTEDQPLTQALVAQKVTISRLLGPEALTLRLTEFGFTPGESIRVIGKALFGSPLYVEVRGAVMALRREEAQCLQVR